MNNYTHLLYGNVHAYIKLLNFISITFKLNMVTPH